MLKIVSNTTPIIALLKIDKLILLKELYGEIIIPKAVYDEINEGKDKTYYADLQQIDWIKILEIKNNKALHYFLELDAGEAEVIVLATEINADLVIIDETLGRMFAKHNNLKVTGSIGILIKAKEKGLVERITPLLDELQEKGFWIGNKLRDKIRMLVKE